MLVDDELEICSEWEAFHFWLIKVWQCDTKVQIFDTYSQSVSSLPLFHQLNCFIPGLTDTTHEIQDKPQPAIAFKCNPRQDGCEREKGCGTTTAFLTKKNKPPKSSVNPTYDHSLVHSYYERKADPHFQK